MMAGGQAQTKSRRYRRMTSFQSRPMLDRVDPELIECIAVSME
jgi:hypothetical protein